jgi:carbon-monoxide dehydrogenase medium subunit
LKPPPFSYYAPDSVDAAVALLASHAGEARLLSGGQSLVPMLNFRLLAPTALIDLARIPNLAYVRHENGTVAIGAMTRQRHVENSDIVAQQLPLLREALGWVGHLPTRSRGTIGGSLANADPSAELPMALLALDGSVVAAGPGGRRTIAATDLFNSMFSTHLASDEILIEVRIPVMVPGSGFAIEEHARRKGDFAIVGVAVVVQHEGDRCLRARIAACGVGSVAVRLSGAEQILERNGLGPAAINAAAASAAAEIDPLTDPNSSADYRRHLTGVLLGRALRRAAGLSPVAIH